ncbi:MAG: tungstate ABC transporter substrate-binding protein WtpA [Deltaproteobacteria bacterium]|nr:tungstate ABC transporter substrate-binding protein WtpA [Deltaproteobacteria bacterium]
MKSTFVKIFVLSLLIMVLNLSNCFAEPKGKVIIFHAGSLTLPFYKMEKIFEAKYPKIDIVREPAGSRRCARKITDLKKACDIMASADYTVIDEMLIPEYANFNIQFATNRVVLCYTDKSRYANEINPDNWYKILLKKGVVWGHSDPNADPCGYRSLMVMQLAEKYYKMPNLYKKLLANRPKKNIRPKSVELISLLKTGNMDYAWEYLSVAVQHELKYLDLPKEINLGFPKYSDFYKQAKVKVTGKKPGIFITKQGKSITYGVTLIKQSPNKEAAILFLKYLLSPDGGLKILDNMGQPPFVPPIVANKKMIKLLPESLKGLVKAKD